MGTYVVGQNEIQVKINFLYFFCNYSWMRMISLPITVHNASLRVRTGPGKPGKSWNFVVALSRTGKCWKKATGPEKFWKSVKLE